jgi:hypothetical protein
MTTPVNLDTLARVLLAAHPNLTDSMHRAVTIALRDGRVNAGVGAYAGHVEHVSASSILALIRRGILVHRYGSAGSLAGELSLAMVRRRDDLLAAHEARHGVSS